MKHTLLALALISCATVSAKYLPEDQAKLDRSKAELTHCEKQVVDLQKKIASLRETIARDSSTASVREAESHTKSIGAMAA